MKCQIVEDGDEEVDLVLGLTWQVVGKASKADEFTQPLRSDRNVELIELHEDNFESDDDDEVEENDVKFESDEDSVLDGYG
ncbi:hypothetical protein Q3G72_020388 [Acer saccharum]|nr:hypothetical protein Q3G72_020388 [Acer saccharum]